MQAKSQAGRGRAGDHGGLSVPQYEGIEQKPSCQYNQKSQSDTYLWTNIYWVLSTNILWYWGMYIFSHFIAEGTEVHFLVPSCMVEEQGSTLASADSLPSTVLTAPPSTA